MGSRYNANSSAMRKRIERHTIDSEDGDEYEATAFGKFGDYFRRKKIKLQNVDAQTRADAITDHKLQIFRGVVAHVIGYTQPPVHTLQRLLVEHGAGFIRYLEGKTTVTHIIASNLPPKKAVDFASCRIVKPKWVTDSVESGRLLPWSHYRMIEEGPRQKLLEIGADGTVTAQANSTPRTDPRGGSYWTSQAKAAAAAPASPTSPTVRYTQRVAHGEAETPITKRFGISGDMFAGPSPTSAQRDAFGGPLEGNPPEAMDFAFDVAIGGPRASQEEEPAPGPPDEECIPSTPLGPLDEPVEEQNIAVDPSDAIQNQPAPDQPEEESPVSDLAGPARLFVPKPIKDMTPEEYNAWLLADPKVRDASCANPNFVEKFYSESRLHHLSTWRAEIKAKMEKLAEQGAVAPTKKLPPRTRRYIMHVDFDSFFCAVSLKKHPEYVDKPAVVAHGSGAGSEIASSNYTARRYGVKNGMWMKYALELCPDLKVLPYDFAGYEEASRAFYEAIIDVGGVVQSISVDEALIDVTELAYAASGSDGTDVGESSLYTEQMSVEELALGLRKKVRERTGCDVSIGIGGNVLLARLALRKAKPAGQYQLKPEKVLDFLEDVLVEDLPGVAGITGNKLAEIGVKLVRDLRQVNKDRLSAVLGPKTGKRLWEYARGIDKQEVGDHPARKSVSTEISWGIRFIDQRGAEEFLRRLSKELERRLLAEQVKGKQLTVKIMRRSPDAPFETTKLLGHGKCDTFNKTVMFGVATHSADIIAKEAISILRANKFSPGDLRGLGLYLVRLESIGDKPSSQKTLTFARAPTLGRRIEEDPIEDEIPRKRARGIDQSDERDGLSLMDTESNATRPRSNGPPRPNIPRQPPFANCKDLSGGINSTPLNISGTQFVLPPNPDFRVLAELPQDILAKLIAPDGEMLPQAAGGQGNPPLPTQIDREVFNALPDYMKSEILISYGRRLSLPQPAADSVPPEVEQARRAKPQKPARMPTFIKRGRGRPRKALERQRDLNGNPIRYLSRTSPAPAQPPPPPPYPNRAHSAPGPAIGNNEEDLEGLDSVFLSELPLDMRREVIEHHRRQLHQDRLKAARIEAQAADAEAVALDVPTDDEDDDGDLSDRPHDYLPMHIPRPPSLIVFPGSSGMTSVDDIKDMLEGWHAATLDDGPHDNDVLILERYLGCVVLEERDMDKARRIVLALENVVAAALASQGCGHREGERRRVRGGWRSSRAKRRGRDAWAQTLERIKDAVRAAVRERGLGVLKI